MMCMIGLWIIHEGFYFKLGNRKWSSCSQTSCSLQILTQTL